MTGVARLPDFLITGCCDSYHRPLCPPGLSLRSDMSVPDRPVKAIDFMYYVATPEFIARWNQAKAGELICHMERAMGGLPQYPSLTDMLARMDAAGWRWSSSAAADER